MRALTVPALAVAALMVPVQGIAYAQSEGVGGSGERRTSLEWSACEDLDAGPVELECATLEVPMETGDRGGRGGETVRIALSRVPATGESDGTLLVNPGGPGSPGRAWARYTAEGLPADLRERYDVVGFDPRGTGASRPSIACDASYFDPVRPDTVPASPEDESVLVQRSADYADACASDGALLEHMRTEDSARDMDRVRQALGVERVDYLGYSFGTLLGGVYATLFPDRVRHMVLDSVVHPGRSWYESNLEQSRALDESAGHFFDWTARNDDAYGLGTDAEQAADAYYRVRAQLAEDPAGGVVGPTEFENAFLTATYTDQAWPPLARALADHVGGDADALVEAHERFGEGPESDPGYGAYLATECTDSPWPKAWPKWSRDGARVHEDAPFIGWNNIWYNAPCASWPADAGPWLQVDGSATADVLLVQASEDGPTPVEGAFAMRERFPGSRLVLEDGGHTHGVSFGGNACVDGAVADYLRGGTLPDPAGTDAADLVCDAPPEPEPAPSGEREPQAAERDLVRLPLR